MQTEYLKDFLMTAKTLNYAAAANNLYISHSSLFKHIKALEEDLGGALFDKNGRFITLSAFGELFLPYASKLVSIEEQCQADLNNWKEEAGTRVRVSSDYRIWGSVYHFQRHYPEYKFQYQEYETYEETARMLSRGIVDFSLLCDAQLDDAAFEKIPYKTDYLAAVLPKEHPLAGQQTLTLSQLRDEDFVMLPQTTTHYRYCESLMRQEAFVPRIVLTCTRGTAIVECIAENGGCSIMMEKLTRNQKNSAVRVIRLEPQTEIHVEIWKARGRKLSPAAKTFLNSLLHEAET